EVAIRASAARRTMLWDGQGRLDSRGNALSIKITPKLRGSFAGQAALVATQDKLAACPCEARFLEELTNAACASGPVRPGVVPGDGISRGRGHSTYQAAARAARGPGR